MTRFGTILIGSTFALGIVSCVKPADAPARTTPEAAAQATTTEEPKKPYKKPVRMTGRGDVSSISLSDFFVLHQSGEAVVFDARPAFFYHLGHVPGAINLPKTRCDEAIHAKESEIKAALAAGKTLVVYCTSWTCPDARTVANHLSGFGYPARIFSGGWDSWKEAGMPTE